MKNKDIVFTLIIPIYNASKTIKRCIDSIKIQTFINFEVILIDDGSTDDSLKKCHDMCKTDKRFTIISQENSGPSRARNIGLDNAKGRYIVFIDSDDYIVQDYLDILYRKFSLTNADIIFYGYYLIDNHENVIDKKIPPKLDYQLYEIISNLSQHDMFGYTWIKAFKKNCIGNKRFNEKTKLYEDEIFTCENITSKTKIAIIDKPLYYYVTDNKNALTKKTYHDYCFKCDLVYKAWKKMLIGYCNKNDILCWKANKFFVNCMYYGFEKKVKIKNFFKEMSICHFFIDYPVNQKNYIYIKHHNYMILLFLKYKYILKNKIYKLIKNYGK